MRTSSYKLSIKTLLTIIVFASYCKHIGFICVVLFLVLEKNVQSTAGKYVNATCLP